jgi:Sulfotransferase domain
MNKVPMNNNSPTIFHITHYKAGSQWVLAILKRCFPELFIQPEPEVKHFLKEKVKPGKVYPTLYVTKEQFESVSLPPNYHKFIIIRDLRDTLISLYFSLKVSHRTINESMEKSRQLLNSMDIEEGLKYMIMNNWLHPNTEIQKSWIKSGERIIRYEELLKNDLEIFEKLLIDEFKMPIQKERLAKVVEGLRFETKTGRKPGTEDIKSHERKGIEGDWKNYFTDEIKDLFKKQYNEILVSTGYEKDMNW